MAKDVIMPVLGMNQDTAVLLSWLKREGDRVEEGEPIMEVETDKATMELDAPASGTLGGVRAAAGEEVKVGSVVAVILAEGEEAPASPDGGAEPAERPAPAERPGMGASAPSASVPDGGPPAAAERGRGAGGGSPAGAPRPAPTDTLAPGPASARGIVPASPKARRLASENGVALEALRGRGRGPEGAVLAADVLAAARAGTAVATGAASRPESGAPPLRFERVLSAAELLAMLAWARDRLDGSGTSLELGDLMARFLAAAWSRQPLDRREGARLRYRRVQDGTSLDVSLSLQEASELPAIVRARTAARSRGQDAPGTDAPEGPGSVATEPAPLSLLDLSDSRAELASASVTLDGALASLVVGRPEERVLARDGEPAVARALRLSFAFDPSRVDLAAAAAFCDRVIALAEEPAALALLY